MNNKSTILRFLILLCVGFIQTEDIKSNSGITGMVIQLDSKKPLQFATVTLIRTKDGKVESGKLTNENGEFFLQVIPKGESH